MDVKEITNLKIKYPQYADMDDMELALRVAKKYPQYADLPEKVRSASEELANKTPLYEQYDLKERPILGRTQDFFGQMGSALLNQASGGLLEAGMKKGGIDINEPVSVPGHIGEALGGALGFGAGIPARGMKLAGKGVMKIAEKSPKLLSAILKSRPIKWGIEGAVGGGLTSLGEPEKISERATIGGAMGAGTGAVVGTLAKTGRGLVKAFNKPEVSKRILSGRASEIMKPEYKETMNEPFVKETVDVFKGSKSPLKKVGEEVSDLITNKYSGTKVDLIPISDEIKQIYKDGLSPDELSSLNKGQFKKVKTIYNKLFNVASKNKDNTIAPKELWDIRKELDGIIYGSTKEQKALKALRSTLNKPLKSLKGVTEVFNQYSDLARAAEALKYGTEDITSFTTGENLSPKLQGFIKGLINNPQEAAMLKKISPEYAEKALDYSTAMDVRPSGGYHGLFATINQLMPLVTTKGAQAAQAVGKGTKKLIDAISNYK